MFLSKFVNQAVEIIVPQIKTKVEIVEEEWENIKNTCSNSINKGKKSFFPLFLYIKT